jgi:hypothetical protein
MAAPDPKVIDDWLIATRETIYYLQDWLRLLEQWRASGRVEPEEFAAGCRQLAEAGLATWAREAGGHGLEALAATLEQNER